MKTEVLVDNVVPFQGSSVRESDADLAANDHILKQALERAESLVAPYWPLRTFIAVNSLHGWEHKHFRKATADAESIFGSQSFLPAAEYQALYRKGVIDDGALELVLTQSLGTAVSLNSTVFTVGGKAGFSGAALAKNLLLCGETPAAESIPFDAAAVGVRCTLSEFIDATYGTLLMKTIEEQSIKWCSAFFDEGVAAWTLPGRERGLFAAFKDLVGFETVLNPLGVRQQKLLAESLPINSVAAVRYLLCLLKIPFPLWEGYLCRLTARLPGWAGVIRHRASQQAAPEKGIYAAQNSDLLAILLTYEYLLITAFAKEKLNKSGDYSGIVGEQRVSLQKEARTQNASGAADSRRQVVVPRVKAALKKLGHGFEELSQAESEKVIEFSLQIVDYLDQNNCYLWLQAHEETYRNKLRAQLPKHVAQRRVKTRPAAQGVFCIDVRSEAFRRHWEASGNYETFGFAGFFALALNHKALGQSERTAQCPVLLSPKYEVDEVSCDTLQKTTHFEESQERSRQWAHVVHGTKGSPVSAFAFVETFGALFLGPLVAKSFLPQKLAQVAQRRRLHVRPQTKLLSNMSIDNQVAVAETALKMMGFVDNFAPVVLIVGHGSSTANNPYAGSLDCGACGGNQGAPNARMAAQIFNSKDVRSGLVSRGIVIPDDTIFLSAQHNTTTDEITVFDDGNLGAEHRRQLQAIQKDWHRAGCALNVERLGTYAGLQLSPEAARKEVKRRSSDWSEVRPEWGLIGNAAFLVGPREWSKSLNMQGRVFLHSYDPATDPSGAFLETILTAPMVVTQWINNQYYFTSVDQKYFGSGNKVLHNIVGKRGVMEGNSSDLKTGLPLQSVSNGHELVHEPLRLLTLVYSAPEVVLGLIRKHEVLQKLLNNEWIHLAVVDPVSGRSQRYDGAFGWRDYE